SRVDRRSATPWYGGQRHAVGRRDVQRRQHDRLLDGRGRRPRPDRGLHGHEPPQPHRVSPQKLPGGHQPETTRHRPPARPMPLGDGTDPSNASLAPGGAATLADAFTFQTASGTDTITAITVSLASGTSAGLSLVEITDNAGSVAYGSVSNPGSDTPAITLSS